MKKHLIAILATVVCAASAYAQSQPVVTETSNDQEKVVNTVTYSKNVMTNDWKYNWELIGAIGSQFYYGDNDKFMKFKDMWSFPTGDLMLTKWASPVIGFTLGITGSQFKGLYKMEKDRETGALTPIEANAHFMTDKFYSNEGTTVNAGNEVLYYRQKGGYINPFIAATFDLSNLFCGYKGDRFYTAQMYAGGGMMIGFDNPVNAHGVSFNLGLVNKLRINERWDFVLNLRGALVSDSFDGESREFDEPKEINHLKKNVPWDGIAGATAGLCLHFGTKKNLHTWTKASDSNTEHFYTPVVLPAEKIIETIHDTVQVNRPVDPDIWFHINFKIDKIDIAHRERVNINAVADFIKTTPDTKYLVCGYADKQTGSVARNIWLAEHRAQGVYDMLVNVFGVNPEQLVIDSKGGVDYMFYKQEELSRCVMIVPLTGKNADEYGERHLTD